MILKKCYISSFGKLKDTTYDFNEKLNTIKEDNGVGKTTLSIFIKAMFYGLDDGKRNIKDNERKKYQPWGTSDMFGGYIDFAFKGCDYRIERFFGKKESEDTVKLFDLATMKEHKNNGSLGERLFGIDKNGFVATCFMGQNDLLNNENDSLITKFNNICENSSSNTFDNAFNLIEEESKKYKARAEKGIIYDKKRQIYSYSQEIDSIKGTETALVKLKADQKYEEENVVLIKQQIESLTKQIEIAGKSEAINLKKQARDKLLQEKQALLNRKQEIFTATNGRFINEEEYNSLFELYNDFVKIKSKIEANSVQKENEKKSLKTPVIFVACMIIALMVGAVVGVVINIVLTIVCASIIEAILLAIFIFFIVNNKKKKIKPQASEEERMLAVAENSINDYLQKLGYADTDISNFIPIINKLKDLSKDYAIILDRQSIVEEELKNYENIAFNENDTNQTGDYNILSSQLQSKQNLLSTTIQDLERKKARIKELEENYSKIKDLETKKDELVESLKEDEEKYDIYTKTLFYLNKANENLKIKYREPLKISLNKYLSFITKDTVAEIDTNLNIKIQENGILKESEYYSKGFQDLFEVCKRFALCDVLFTTEKPFIILDDIFFNLDDTKLTQALEAIKDLSNEYQIIYFVCHESRRA